MVWSIEGHSEEFPRLLPIRFELKLHVCPIIDYLLPAMSSPPSAVRASGAWTSGAWVTFNEYTDWNFLVFSNQSINIYISSAVKLLTSLYYTEKIKYINHQHLYYIWESSIKAIDLYFCFFVTTLESRDFPEFHDIVFGCTSHDFCR
jgi:hypothetical protein